MSGICIQAGMMRARPAGGVTYYGEVISDAPIGYWRLGEPSGTTAADEIGSYVGTYAGTYTLAETSGLSDGDTALGLSGVSGDMQAAPQAAIAGLGAATLECWMYRGATGRIVVAGFGATNSRRMNILWFSDNRIYFQVENGGSAYRHIAASLTGWHHVAMVFDGSLSGSARIACYLDGVLQSPTSSGTPPATLGTSAQLGNISAGREISNSRFSNGRIDELAIYDYALTSTQIADHYAAA